MIEDEDEENNVEEEVEEKKDVLTIAQIEELVNMKAKELAKNLKLSPKNRFKIFLVPGDEPLFRMERGTTVNIYMQGVNVMENKFWDMLRQALRDVPRVQEPYELEVRKTLLERREEARKYIKIKFEKDISEIYKHLIPENQLKIKTETITRVVVTDAATKKSVTVESKDAVVSVRKLINEARFKLSRLVYVDVIQEEEEDGNES